MGLEADAAHLTACDVFEAVNVQRRLHVQLLQRTCNECLRLHVRLRQRVQPTHSLKNITRRQVRRVRLKAHRAARQRLLRHACYATPACATPTCLGEPYPTPNPSPK